MFKTDKKDKYINFTGLKEIEIGCKDELTFNILNSLKNLWGNGIRAKITFSRDVTMLDVVIHHLVMCEYGYLTRIGMEGNTKDRGLDKRSISFIRKFLETSKISKADSYRHGRSMNLLDELELKLKKIEHYTNARKGEFKELGIYDELLQIVKGIREEKNNRLRELGEI